MTTRTVLGVLLAVVAACAAVLSFSALRDLAAVCGFAVWAAPLLPLVIDAGAAAGTLAWVSREGRARRFGRALALVLLATSVGGNAVGHVLGAYALTPPWWLVVAVSGVAPAVLGAVVHLAVVGAHVPAAGAGTVAGEPAEPEDGVSPVGADAGEPVLPAVDARDDLRAGVSGDPHRAVRADAGGGVWAGGLRDGVPVDVRDGVPGAALRDGVPADLRDGGPGGVWDRVPGVRDGVPVARDGLPGGVHGGLRDGLRDGPPGGARDGVAGAARDGVAGGVRAGAPGGAHGGVRDGLPGGVRDGVPGVRDGAPGGAHGGVRDGLPGGVRDGVPGVRDGAPDGVPGGTPAGPRGNGRVDGRAEVRPVAAGGRAAKLIAAGAGRRRLARELGITEHEARALLAASRDGSRAGR